MAGELKLNNVSVATESGGVVSLSAANTLAFPVGHVIQVQTASTSTEVANWTNDTWVDSNLSVNITPKFNNSKIYFNTAAGVIVTNSSYMGLRIHRSSPSSASLLPMMIYQSSANWTPGLGSYIGVDTPNTTSQCTYMLQIYKDEGSSMWN